MPVLVLIQPPQMQPPLAYLWYVFHYTLLCVKMIIVLESVMRQRDSLSYKTSEKWLWTLYVVHKYLVIMSSVRNYTYSYLYLLLKKRCHYMARQQQG